MYCTHPINHHLCARSLLDDVQRNGNYDKQDDKSQQRVALALLTMLEIAEVWKRWLLTGSSHNLWYRDDPDRVVCTTWHKQWSSWVELHKCGWKLEGFKYWYQRLKSGRMSHAKKECVSFKDRHTFMVRASNTPIDKSDAPKARNLPSGLCCVKMLFDKEMQN